MTIKVTESERELCKMGYFEEKLKAKLGAPAEGLRIVFYDETGVPYTSGIDVGNFTSSFNLGG